MRYWARLYIIYSLILARLLIHCGYQAVRTSFIRVRHRLINCRHYHSLQQPQSARSANRPLNVNDGRDSPATCYTVKISVYQWIRSDWSSAIQYLPHGAKIVKIGPADPEILRLRVRYDTKLVAMATSLEESEKLDRIDNMHTNTFHLVKKAWKSVL